MKYTTIRPLANPPQNEGDAREWAYAKTFGINRTKHDSGDYRTSADIEYGSRRISVKSGAFSLMSPKQCEGQTTMEGIWAVYERTTYANEHAYITADYRVFNMNEAVFKEFVFTFGSVQRESTANGAGLKIKLGHETKKRVAWLEAHSDF